MPPASHDSCSKRTKQRAPSKSTSTKSLNSDFFFLLFVEVHCSSPTKIPRAVPTTVGSSGEGTGA
eukprot:5164908-Pleurochrysis_carterae.AAC.1